MKRQKDYAIAPLNTLWTGAKRLAEIDIAPEFDLKIANILNLVQIKSSTLSIIFYIYLLSDSLQ